MTRIRFGFLTLAVVAACSGTSPTSDGAAGAGGDDGAAGAAGAPACAAEVAQHTDEGARHILDCGPAVYGTNPPSSGNHYESWADYKTYATPVPWGHLVHSLEHGAVVLVYNCADGCPDEVARAQAFIDTLPPAGPLAAGQVDSTCVAPTRRRLILAPDPKLDVRWAATAWTWTLRAPCFDESNFGAFIKAHYGQTFEDFCSEIHPTFCAQ